MKPERELPKDILLDSLLRQEDGPGKMLSFVRKRKVVRQIWIISPLLMMIAAAALMKGIGQTPSARSIATSLSAKSHVQIKFINDEELHARLKDQPYAIVGSGEHRKVLLLNHTFTPSDSL